MDAKHPGPLGHHGAIIMGSEAGSEALILSRHAGLVSGEISASDPVTIHTSHGLKGGGSLSSPFLMVFVLIMAASFVATTILGIAIALKLGKSRRAAVYCLAAGVLVPLIIIGLTAWTR